MSDRLKSLYYGDIKWFYATVLKTINCIFFTIFFTNKKLFSTYFHKKKHLETT